MTASNVQQKDLSGQVVTFHFGDSDRCTPDDNPERELVGHVAFQDTGCSAANVLVAVAGEKLLHRVPPSKVKIA